MDECRHGRYDTTTTAKHHVLAALADTVRGGLYL
jgi:hypothetical protein